MSWKVIKELNEKRAKAFADATKLREDARTAGKDLTAEEEVRHTALLTDVTNFGKQIERETAAAALGETLERQAPGRPNVEGENSLGMPAKDFKKFSLCRAIGLAADRKPIDGLEFEVSQELATRSGKAAKGFYFPIEAGLPVNNRTLLDTTQGAGAIPTIVSSTFIEILRNRMVTVGLGATVMPDMSGNFSIPKQTQAGTAYWVADGGATTTSNQVLGQVPFSAKTVGAYTDISRRFIKNATLSAEEFVRNDLARVLAIELERAALYGSGSSNQPLGIVPNITANATGQIHAQGTNGAALAFSDVVAMETLVATQNADVGRLAYITNAKVRGATKVTPKSSTAASVGFIFEDGEMNGYQVGVTNIVPSNGTKGTGTNLSSLLFGDITSLYYALWGGLDILVDPYTGGTAGTVRVDALQDADINCRHLESFSICTDIIA